MDTRCRYCRGSMEGRAAQARYCSPLCARRNRAKREGPHQVVLSEHLCECGCGERTSVARDTNPLFGHVRGKPFRYKAGHNNRGKELRGPRYRVDDRGYVTPCWIWQLARGTNGYGSAPEGGTAHRRMYERARGPVPVGLHVDHLCRQRDCVNPEHLQVVNCAENSRRGDNAKLTYAEVEEIQSLRAQGWLQQDVADAYSVSRATIGDIEHGRTWATEGIAL